MWEINANELHAKLGHPREDRMCATLKHLHYSVKGKLSICEEYSTAKSYHKLLHKKVEERDLQPGEMIYYDIS